MYSFRDRVFVQVGLEKIEGYIFSVLPSKKEFYVVLTGQNTKPVLVPIDQISPIDGPKRKRGRPRKDEK
jgi:hypothetical protein